MIVNLAGFVALGAMLLTLFTWLRQDNRALRAEMRAEIKELREEMNARFEKQSEEMNARFEKQSEEMNARFEKQSEEIGQLRKQTKRIGEEVGQLRERTARIEGLLEANILRGKGAAAPEPPHPEAA